MVVVHSPDQTVASPAFAATVKRVSADLQADDRIATVAQPQPGTTISADRHTAIVMGGAAADSNEMVRAADDLKEPITALGNDRVQVAVTGASGMWSDFNTANRDAMMKSEMISWPVTLAILLLAFGSMVAAGLPLLLTILGLVASAGSLFLLTLLTPVSIWAMNFALMFALALGIDYALFIVYRFRGALFGQHENPVEAVEETMDTAGKAVLFSGLTVLISLTAVMLVDSPAFRSMAVGIMLSVIFVLAATLTLLPAVLAKLGPADRQVLAALGPFRGASLTALRRLGRVALEAPVAARDRHRGRARRAGLSGALAGHRHALDQGRPRRGHQPGRLRARPVGVRPRRAGSAPGRRPDRRGERPSPPTSPPIPASPR